MPGVVVDSQKVDWPGNERHVTRLDGGHGVAKNLDHIGWVDAAEDSVEEPAIAIAVVETRCREIVILPRGRDDPVEIERDTHLGVGCGLPDDLHCPAVREEYRMRGRQ